VKRWLAVVCMLLVAFSAQARKMNIVKIQTGGTFGDATVKQALSEEHPGKNGVSLEVEFAKDTWLGEYNPKPKDWSKAETITIEAFNPSKKIIKFMMTVVPKDLGGQKRYDARSDNPFLLVPNENKIVLDLGDFMSNSGSPLDLSDILQFNLTTEVPKCTIYFQALYLTLP